MFDKGDQQALAGKIIMPFDVVDNDLDTWIAYDYHPAKYGSRKVTMTLKDAMFHLYEEDPYIEPSTTYSPESPRARSPGSPKRDR